MWCFAAKNNLLLISTQTKHRAMPFIILTNPPHHLILQLSETLRWENVGQMKEKKKTFMHASKLFVFSVLHDCFLMLSVLIREMLQAHTHTFIRMCLYLFLLSLKQIFTWQIFSSFVLSYTNEDSKKKGEKFWIFSLFMCVKSHSHDKVTQEQKVSSETDLSRLISSF